MMIDRWNVGEHKELVYRSIKISVTLKQVCQRHEMKAEEVDKLSMYVRIRMPLSEFSHRVRNN